jgi:hypothetical protein
MRFRPKYAAVAGGAAAALLVAGCGSSGSPLAARHGTGSDNAVLAAYTTTMKAKSARIKLNETVKTTGLTENVKGSGVMSMTKKEGQFSFTAPGVGTLQEIVLLPNLYVQLPAAARSQIPGHKQWVGININTVTKAKLGATLSQMSSSSEAPTDTLAQLGAVSSNGIKKVGSATLDGVRTTEYSADIDLSKTATDKPAAVKAAVQKLESALGHRSVPIKVWIDSQGRVRQISYSMTVTENGKQFSVSLMMGLTAFNVPVHVSAPPASETFNITNKILNSGGASGSL